MRTPSQQIYKYPRTHHIEGSRLQPGDEDLDSIPFRHLAGCHLVVEEKMDGANCAVSFTADGDLLLQSRGHYLTGGRREKHFNLFKTWAGTYARALFDVLGHRYIMYGEWLYAKHTVFYNRLPHYFMEFDILDTDTGNFLSTPVRQAVLKPLEFVHSVKVLREGELRNVRELTSLVGPSFFIADGHLEQLGRHAEDRGLDVDRVKTETDDSSLMEGLYVKSEADGVVTGRYKFVRASFLTSVKQSKGHWLNRPIIPNLLSDGVDLFGAHP